MCVCVCVCVCVRHGTWSAGLGSHTYEVIHLLHALQRGPRRAKNEPSTMDGQVLFLALPVQDQHYTSESDEAVWLARNSCPQVHLFRPG